MLNAQIAHLVFANAKIPPHKKPKELFFANAQLKFKKIR